METHVTVRVPRSALLAVLAVLAAAIVALVLAEAVAQVLVGRGAAEDRPLLKFYGTSFLVRYDPVLGWRNPPGERVPAQGNQREIAIDSLGFRDREYPVRKAPGTFRVLVLGDSLTWGWGVGQDEVYPKLLERRLNDALAGRPPVEVIDAGVVGYGTDQEYLLFREVGPRLAPDLVVLYFYWNDLLNNNSSFQYEVPKPFFLDRGGAFVPAESPVPRVVYRGREPWLLRPRAWLHGLASYRVLLTRAQTRFAAARALGALGLVRLEPATEQVGVYPDPVERSVRLVAMLRESVAASRARFLCVRQPSWDQLAGLAPDGPLPPPDPLVKALLREKIPTLDLMPSLVRSGIRREEFGQADNDHFNARGHAAVAEILYQYLREIGALPRP